MSTLVNKATFSPSTNRKGTPKKTHPNKENLLAGTGTPVLTSSNGKLKGHFTIFNDSITGSSGKKGKNPKRRSLAPLQPTVDDESILTGRDAIVEWSEEEKDKDAATTADVESKPEEKDNSLVQDALSLLKELYSDEEEEATAVPVGEAATESTSDSGKDTLVKDALALMKATETADDDGYWKSIAEERRVALEETLDENDKLYDEIDRLKLENDELRRELSEVSCYKVLYLSQREEAESDSSTVTDPTDQ